MLRGTMAVLMLVGLTDAASASTCRLEVGGEVFLDGGCQYEEDSDGSFRFFDDSDPRMFVYVNMNGDGTAQGYWPGPDGGTHAHDISDGCIRFLEACPNPDQVLNSLADHITPNGWSGSRADIMDRNTNALAVLVEHPDPRIAEATRRVVVEARSWIMKERDRERREDEASEQTFE